MHPRIHAQNNPNRPALIRADTGETRTYGELEKLANQGAHFLRSLAINKGKTISIWLTNCIAYLDIYWAAQRAGLYITPISTALTAEEAAYIINDCSAKLAVIGHDVKGAPEYLKNHNDLTPNVGNILTINEEMSGIQSWYKAIENFPITPIEDESAGFHMVYSSGTTGKPKGVKIPLSGGDPTEILPMAASLKERYAVDENTVFLSPAPMYHTAPLFYSTAVQRAGGTVVIMKKFDPEAALEAIEKYKITFTQMVPTMFIRLLRLSDETRKKYDISSLTHVVHAAAPCPVDIKWQMINWWGPIIYEYYGATEGNGSTTITPEEWMQKPGSVGKASWGTIHVCDDEGNEVGANIDGDVYFEGGWDFAYLNDDKKTSDARHPINKSWTTLGDIGHLDEDGYLFLTDRKSYMIISGGVNIYPQEAENLLSSHPKVADVAVFGVPNKEMGEEVKAVVEPKNWADAGKELEKELIEYCRLNISHIKCPRTIDFEKELPRHETGKLYKRLIKDKYWPQK